MAELTPPVFFAEDGETTWTFIGSGEWVYTLRDGVVSMERNVNYQPPSPAQLYRNYSANDKKGVQLLHSLLTAEQKQQLDDNGWFKVTGSAKGIYRIGCTTTVFNVTRFHRSTKQYMYRLCAGPYGVTYNDFWLAQKLMIEADEKRFLRIANKSD